MADTMIYTLNLGPYDPDTEVREVLISVAGVNETQSLNVNPKINTIKVTGPQDSLAVITVVDVDDSGNKSVPVVHELILLDTVAPMPGSTITVVAVEEIAEVIDDSGSGTDSGDNGDTPDTNGDTPDTNGDEPTVDDNGSNDPGSGDDSGNGSGDDVSDDDSGDAASPGGSDDDASDAGDQVDPVVGDDASDVGDSEETETENPVVEEPAPADDEPAVEEPAVEDSIVEDTPTEEIETPVREPSEEAVADGETPSDGDVTPSKVKPRRSRKKND